MKIDNNKYYHSLSLNLRHTIYRSWSREKFKIYVELFFLNPSLFIRVILFNVIAPLREKISNLIKRVSKY